MGSTVPLQRAMSKAGWRNSAVFLTGTVDKLPQLGYRAAHGDWLCRSATVFLWRRRSYPNPHV